MEDNSYELESFKPFSESLIWQLNRDFYQNTGIDAWSKGMLPHQLTSNSMVGKTYAELILGCLKDLAAKDNFRRRYTFLNWVQVTVDLPFIFYNT